MKMVAILSNIGGELDRFTGSPQAVADYVRDEMVRDGETIEGGGYTIKIDVLDDDED